MPLEKSRGGGHSLSQKANSDASNLTDANITSWQNKLNNMTKPSAGGTVSNKQAVVVETYVSSDRRTRYRVWSDGWKEVYMRLPRQTSSRTITLPIAFTENYLMIQATLTEPTSSTGAVPWNQIVATQHSFTQVDVGAFGGLIAALSVCGY